MSLCDLLFPVMENYRHELPYTISISIATPRWSCYTPPEFVKTVFRVDTLWFSCEPTPNSLAASAYSCCDGACHGACGDAGLDANAQGRFSGVQSSNNLCRAGLRRNGPGADGGLSSLFFRVSLSLPHRD